MSHVFKLPDLGEGISEVEVRRWLVREGDRVREHQSMVEVETDKAVVEVPSPFSGTVLSIKRREGEIVQVGEVLLEIGEEHELAPKEPAAQRRPSVGIVGELPEAEPEAVPTAPREPLATPSVRKKARELGISLYGIRGSGPHGSITHEDLEGAQPAAAAPHPLAEDADVELIPMRGVRRAVARNVLAAHRASALVTTMEEADVTELWEMRDREQREVESRGVHLTFLPFFMKAALHALKDHPNLNAAVDEEGQVIIRKKRFHFGIAVDTEEGLMVPVIRDVDRKTIRELAADLMVLGKKARERSITLEELKGSTFTLTNYGHFGGRFSTPIVNAPDVAILGCGRITERPWVYRGSLAVRKILPLSLTFDHRVTDGAEAGRFLMQIVHYLEDPALLLIESV
ncbi:dihydrolipoamide acetyltransferase family protein [Geomesophilobacter sediminis]|uniref:Dihydrolipoamide acetyltransferase component of pyruvate dehydrogenase complex n=1 Tax=Geomesophilobacter sediminis TaxID=2798584 RepID=A0A8J7IMW2_9BACT|nr:dihydrolipoamide acetyltransferase family protein [Geomesophilobacter sediminis]MBJ6723199.1 2-oxo acid dehydrogenase subunit E2 [Geomesophilobacter sediminis]